MEVRATLRSFIEACFFVDGFSDDASFLHQGIVDSMGIAQLVTFVEERWGLSVDDEELVPENLDSVDRLASFVERKLRRAAA